MSRRQLKKEIKSVFNLIILDLVFYIEFVDGSDREEAKKLLNTIPAIADEYVDKMSNRDLQPSPKKYFNQLIEDLNKTMNDIADEITALP